ncbi:type VI secretion protein, partial [Escherichia coli]|nr:type VI secretion protein [Escherichia coli]
MMLWFMTGAFMAVVGALLFIIRASEYVKALNDFSIWWLALTPPGGWFFLFCLRHWQWSNQMDEHLFLKKEGEYAQKQWESWAERYLVITASCVYLPDKITVATLCDELPLQYGLVKKIDYLSDSGHKVEASLRVLLREITDKFCQLPAVLPVNVTLITDQPDSEIRSAFVSAWEVLFPQRVVPDNIEVTPDFSMGWVDERLKQPVLTVDLILVIQLNGGNAYSDGLAALLLTSDDVAQKYNLPHPARLLRPMSLDINKFNDEFTLFLETQTAACR